MDSCVYVVFWGPKDSGSALPGCPKRGPAAGVRGTESLRPNKLDNGIFIGLHNNKVTITWRLGQEHGCLTQRIQLDCPYGIRSQTPCHTWFLSPHHVWGGVCVCGWGVILAVWYYGDRLQALAKRSPSVDSAPPPRRRRHARMCGSRSRAGSACRGARSCSSRILGAAVIFHVYIHICFLENCCFIEPSTTPNHSPPKMSSGFLLIEP